MKAYLIYFISTAKCFSIAIAIFMFLFMMIMLPENDDSYTKIFLVAFIFALLLAVFLPTEEVLREMFM